MKCFSLSLLFCGVNAFSSQFALGVQSSKAAIKTRSDIHMATSVGLGVMAEKVGMTQLFSDDGKHAIPCTVLKVDKNVITQLKTEEKCGYNAVQIGYDEVPERKLNKPELGDLQKNGLPLVRHRTEFKVADTAEYSLGAEIGLEIFEEGDKVMATGTSSGKGFQGTIKRHHFTRGPMAHGSKNHRAPGSIGMGTDPGRVLPGKKMAGQMGNKQTTIKGLEIVKKMDDEGILILKGAVPGKKGATIRVAKGLW